MIQVWAAQAGLFAAMFHVEPSGGAFGFRCAHRTRIMALADQTDVLRLRPKTRPPQVPGLGVLMRRPPLVRTLRCVSPTRIPRADDPCASTVRIDRAHDRPARLTRSLLLQPQARHLSPDAVQRAPN